jgi:hypothetical protein
MNEQTPEKTTNPATAADLNQNGFLNYGVGQVAYVRHVSGPDASGYGIFAANGAQIAVASDSSSAYGFLMEHDLMPVVLH